MSRNAPVVTVLMSVRDGAAYVESAIDSILGQSFGDFELLLIDDGSVDRTPALLAEAAARDERVRVVANGQNIGLTRSLNLGMSLARGRYIARQDADDLSAPDRLERQVGYLERHRDVGVVGCWARVCGLDADAGRTTVWRTPEAPVLVRWHLLFSNCMVHGSVMLRRALYEAGFRYDEGIRHGQDYDLWNRAAAWTQIANLSAPLYTWRVHAGAVGARHADGQEATLRQVLRRELPALLQRPVDDEEIELVRRTEQGSVFAAPRDLVRAVALVEEMRRRFVARDRLGRLDRHRVNSAAAHKLARIARRNLAVWPRAALRAGAEAIRLDPLIWRRLFAPR